MPFLAMTSQNTCCRKVRWTVFFPSFLALVHSTYSLEKCLSLLFAGFSLIYYSLSSFCTLQAPYSWVEGVVFEFVLIRILYQGGYESFKASVYFRTDVELLCLYCLLEHNWKRCCLHVQRYSVASRGAVGTVTKSWMSAQSLCVLHPLMIVFT